MAEPPEWGLNKFWTIIMWEHGIDEVDEQSVEQLFVAVEDGEVEIDKSVVESIEEWEKHKEPSEPAFWLPPASVPGEETLGAEAPETAIMRHMRRVHEWAGSDWQLTTGDEPIDFDVDELAAVVGA